MFKKEQYMPLVEQGYLSRNVHPEDENVVILNYTEQTVFERKWNEITLACRGLILNEVTGEVLARPFLKFFNYGEETGSCLMRIPKEQPEITIKHDGSLGIMYRLNGKIRWATRGSFVSEQAKIAQEIWDKKYGTRYVPENLTLLVEIIHPQTRVVVDYNGMEELMLIGVVDRLSGTDYDYDGVSIASAVLGLPATELVNGSIDSVLAKAKTLDANNEGFVLRWKNGLRLKVKGDKYLEVHRIIHGLSMKQKVASWANGNLDDYIKMLPEEFRPEIEKVAEQCQEIFDRNLHYINSQYKRAEKRGRKNFALWVDRWVVAEMKNFMFLMYDGEHEKMEQKLKDYIAKHYKEVVIL